MEGRDGGEPTRGYRAGAGAAGVRDGFAWGTTGCVVPLGLAGTVPVRRMLPLSMVRPAPLIVWKNSSSPTISISMNAFSVSFPEAVIDDLRRSPVRSFADDPSVKYATPFWGRTRS